jgi:hypothetical protein
MHNTPPINARPPVGPHPEIIVGETSTSRTRQPSSPPSSLAEPFAPAHLSSPSGKGLSDLPAEVLMKIAGYVPYNDLRSMRLSTPQLKNAAENNMPLLIKGREELLNLVDSKNFRHPQQVTLIGAYEPGDSDDLRTAVKGRIIDLGRTPEETAAAYFIRLTGAGISRDQAARAAVPAMPRLPEEPQWSYFGRLFETGMSARDAATIAEISVPEAQGHTPFQQAHFYVGRGFDISEAADLVGHREDHDFTRRLLGTGNNYGALLARIDETESWQRSQDQN